MSSDPALSSSASGSQKVRPSGFKRGEVVHVKAGAPHPIYPDLPMGGWTGTIQRTQRHKQHKHRRYWVHFLPSTTEQLHPVYADRESRDNPDGYDAWDNWVPAESLEAGEAPPETIEQPDLPTWAQQAGERQVRLLFGLNPDEEYPSCNDKTARVWRDFLSKHIPLPRQVQATVEYDFDCGEIVLLRILGPEEVPSDVGDEAHALYGEVSVNGEIEVTRLEFVIPFEGDPYDTLLRDYEHWYDVVHRDHGFWTPGDDEGMSRGEFDQMYRVAWNAAWKATFGRLPDESDVELAKSLADQLKDTDAGRLFDRTEEPVVEEPKEIEIAEPIRAAPRVGRNDPCPCGSGKKFKKCCLRER